MSQTVVCRGCAKRLKAPDSLAGRTVNCPVCGETVAIPRLTADAGGAVASEPPSASKPATIPAAPAGKSQLASSIEAIAAAAAAAKLPPATSGLTAAKPPAARAPLPATSPFPQAAPSRAPTPALVAVSSTAAASKSAVAPPHAGGPRDMTVNPPRRRGVRPRGLYLLFLATLIPLGFQSFAPPSDVESRVEQTIAAHPEIVAKMQELGDEASDDVFFEMLPEHRLDGAHLPRETWIHWLYAAAAAAVMFGLIRALFEPGRSTFGQLLLVAAITATVGIVSLIMFQWIADFTQGFWVRGRGVITLLFYVVKFIGFSYRAALDPENGFALSFLGFTCGVGLCEELTKILPVVVMLEKNKSLGWRGACALGLASGVGFGVAEGIMYSANYYNGLSGWDIYLTRFASCVGLHAVWAAAAGVMADQQRHRLDAADGSDWITQILLIISVPMILHGLYDTLLKREMNGWALGVAVLSFAWLAWAIERARAGEGSGDPEAAAFA